MTQEQYDAEQLERTHASNIDSLLERYGSGREALVRQAYAEARTRVESSARLYGFIGPLTLNIARTAIEDTLPPKAIAHPPINGTREPQRFATIPRVLICFVVEGEPEAI